MKLKNILTVSFAVVFSCTMSLAQSLSPSTKTHWDKGTLIVDTPTRPAGQQHVLGLTAPKLETVRVAFVYGWRRQTDTGDGTWTERNWLLGKCSLQYQDGYMLYIKQAGVY